MRHQAPLRIGVIGVGKLGELHLKLLKELATERSDIQCAGFYEASSPRAVEIEKRFACRAFSSIEDIVPEIDAAIIATPTSLHAAVAEIVMKAGKHVFIEKPIASSLTQTSEIRKWEKEMRVVLQVGHIERFNPALVAALPHLGIPRFIVAERLAGFSKRATDVSVVLDLMIHDIDLILSLVKSPINHISASGASVFSTQLDIANAHIEFENGSVASVTASRISRTKVRKMRLFTHSPNAYASLDLLSGKSDVFKLIPKDTVSTRQRRLKEFATEKMLLMFGEIEDTLGDHTIDYHALNPPKINALKMEQESFIDAVLYGKDIAVTSQDAEIALATAEEIVKKITAATARHAKTNLKKHAD